MKNPYADKSPLQLLHAVEQLLTTESDDLGFHIRAVPMSIDLARAIRATLDKATVDTRCEP